MKGLAHVIGWILVIGGIIAIGVIIYLVATDRFVGNFLTGLLLCAPAALVAVIGFSLTRVGRKAEEATTKFGDPDAQWTRRSIR